MRMDTEASRGEAAAEKRSQETIFGENPEFRIQKIDPPIPRLAVFFLRLLRLFAAKIPWSERPTGSSLDHDRAGLKPSASRGPFVLNSRFSFRDPILKTKA